MTAALELRNVSKRFGPRKVPVWALSDARGHAVRNLLEGTGFQASRIQRVTAYADRRNRSTNPMDPNNNRIEVILLRRDR